MPTCSRSTARASTGVIVENADHDQGPPPRRRTCGWRPGATEKLVETTLEAARDELVRGLGGLLGQAVPVRSARAGRRPRRRGRGGHARELRDRARALSAARPGRGRRRGLPDPLAVERDAALHGDRRQQRPRRALRDVRVPAAACRRRSRSAGSTSRPRRRSSTATSTTGTRSACTPATTRPGTGGLNGENGAVFDFAAPAPAPRKNLPVILDRYIVVARALGVARHQRHHDQQRQRQQRLPDDGVHRAGGGAGRRAAAVRHPARAVDPLHRADRRRFAPDTLTNAQLDPYGAAFRGWWTRKAQQIQAVDPGLPRLHRQGQLRGPARPAGLRLRPRRRRQRHRRRGRAARA